ncbi:MAG: putative isomerase YddE [Holosporales bacterium]
MHLTPVKVEKFTKLTYWQVDAFTTVPFKGNPAAVICVDDFPSTNDCQKIAAHLNLSQTAFVKPLKKDHYHIRWFSPKDEAPICGHATLASAHVLFFEQNLNTTTITFESLAGPLTVHKNEDDSLTLVFPKKAIFKTQKPALLEKALGICEANILNILWDETIFVIELDSMETVQHLSVNLDLIKKIPCRAICVTAKGKDDIDFVSRYFAPSVGIDEDPVCGSAHCRLTPYWAEKLNKKKLIALQLSKRTGLLKLTENQDRVHIQAHACVVLEGKILGCL